MRFIADTHALIWWWTENEAELSGKANALFRDGQSEIVVSAASVWEIATKHRLGKLPELDDVEHNLPRLIASNGFVSLAIDQPAALMAGSFPARHGDPFDRMLAAQAIVEGMPILSIDDKLDQFGCKRIWE